MPWAAALIALAAAQAQTIRVGGNIQAAKPEDWGASVAPANVQGVVRFNVTLDKDGRVKSAVLVSGPADVAGLA